MLVGTGTPGSKWHCRVNQNLWYIFPDHSLCPVITLLAEPVISKDSAFSKKRVESYGFLSSLLSYKYSTVIFHINVVLTQLFYQLFCFLNILEKFLFTDRGNDDIIHFKII